VASRAHSPAGEGEEFTRQREELAQLRRALPWEKVEKQYVFDGPGGKETLPDLFGKHSQLVVYHFMFGPVTTRGVCTALSGPTRSTAPVYTCRTAM
jgi:predicted dithiol-disulfide oxidoreductase (DUF899 family)